MKRGEVNKMTANDPVLVSIKRMIEMQALSNYEFSELVKMPCSSVHSNETITMCMTHMMGDLAKFCEVTRKRVEQSDSPTACSHERMIILQAMYVINWFKIILGLSGVNVPQIIYSEKFETLFNISYDAHKNLKPFEDNGLQWIYELSDMFMKR